MFNSIRSLKAALNRLARMYFSSAWLPPVLALMIFGLLFVSELWLHNPFVGLTLLLTFMASFLGILVSAIIQLVKGRKLCGTVNLLALPIVGLIAAWGIGFIAFSGLFNNEPDNFGKDIVIPAGMNVSDPVDRFDEPSVPAVDELTENIVAAFRVNAVSNGSSSVSTDLTILNEFATTNRQKLIEYLSASPRWFVTEERGKAYAYRRLVIGGRWQNTLNGFYCGYHVSSSLNEPFQTRIIIGFDGTVFTRPFQEIQTSAKTSDGEVQIRVVDDKKMNQGKESYFVLQSSRAAVEIFEQSHLDVRPATQMALSEIKRELEAALVSNTAVVPAQQSSTTNAEPLIELANGMQGGIYQVRAFANPGESGKVYLKVFEATKNTPLSAERIKPRSLSRIGWSTNPNEQFRYQSEITVYEGDWGTFYPGRFELWFIPDSGEPERKLVEQTFRIEGWMR